MLTSRSTGCYCSEYRSRRQSQIPRTVPLHHRSLATTERSSCTRTPPSEPERFPRDGEHTHESRLVSSLCRRLSCLRAWGLGCRSCLELGPRWRFLLRHMETHHHPGHPVRGFDFSWRRLHATSISTPPKATGSFRDNGVCLELS